MTEQLNDFTPENYQETTNYSSLLSKELVVATLAGLVLGVASQYLPSDNPEILFQLTELSKKGAFFGGFLGTIGASILAETDSFHSEINSPSDYLKILTGGALAGTSTGAVLYPFIG